MRVGYVEYINALPFTLPLQQGMVGCHTENVYGVPSALSAMLRAGKLDVALTSSTESMDGGYDHLPGLGIVGHGRVLSVNLYTRTPPEDLGGKRLALTHHSAASSALLEVLCHHHWKCSPRFEPLDRTLPYTTYDAFLLIGDEALKQQEIAGFHTIDLAAAWHAMTALPFVFALFSVKPHTLISHLQNELEAALEWSASNPQAIHTLAAARCALPLDFIRYYYSVLGYRLGIKEMESLTLFKNLRHDIPKIAP